MKTRAAIVTGWLIAANSFAAPITWTNAGGGLWNEPSNWSTGTVPTVSDDVTLPDLGGPYTVLAISATSAATINIAASDAELWVQGNASANSTLTTTGLINAGTLRVESLGVPNQSHLTINGGAFENNGNFVVGQGGGGSRLITGDIVNNGITTIETTCTFFGAGKTFEMNGGTLDLQDEAYFTMAFVFNDGQILGQLICSKTSLTVNTPNALDCLLWNTCTYMGDISAAQSIWVQGGTNGGNARMDTSGLINEGVLRLESLGASNQSHMNINGGVLDNRGTLLVGQGSGGTRSITGDITNTGTITIQEATSFTASPDLIMNGGTLDIQDQAVISAGSFTFNDGDVLGQITVSNSTLNLNNTNPLDAVLWSVCTLNGDLAASQSLWVQGGAGGNARLTTSGMINNGLIRLESQGAANQSHLSINGGTLVNNGDLIVAQGSGGTRTITGNVTNAGNVLLTTNATISNQLILTPSSLLQIEIGGPALGAYTRLYLNQAAVLDGVLDVRFVNGYTPTLNDDFEIINAACVSPGFSDIIGDGDFVETYASGDCLSSLRGSVWLASPQGPCPALIDGDVNGDGVVDLTDLSVVLSNFGFNCQ